MPETMQLAGSYLSVFEGRAGALMRDLGDALDAAARRTDDVARLVRAANDAFRTQRQWYGRDLETLRRRAAAQPERKRHRHGQGHGLALLDEAQWARNSGALPSFAPVDASRCTFAGAPPASGIVK
jgi:hypothetical protein